MADVNIRQAKQGDFTEIRQLIQVKHKELKSKKLTVTNFKELADFEKMSDFPKIDARTLENDLCAEDSPFLCFVVEETEKKKLVGYTVCNVGFSISTGKKLYIEDIYVTESHRGQGVGSKLFSRICQEALIRACSTIDFIVLDWNPAMKFYHKFGAIDMTLQADSRIYYMPQKEIEKMALTGINCAK